MKEPLQEEDSCARLLTGNWLTYYRFFSKNAETSVRYRPANPARQLYNQKLAEHLLELQSKDVAPDRASLALKCEEIMDGCERTQMLGGETERLDFERILTRLEGMDFAPSFHTHDRKGQQLMIPQFRIDSIIPCEALSDNEINHILEFINTFCYGGKGSATFDKNWNSIIFTIYSAPACPSNRKRNLPLLFNACFRHILILFNQYQVQMFNHHPGIKFCLIRRIMDWFILRIA